MTDILVNWSGIETRPWRDASAFVIRVQRLGEVAYIDLDRAKFPGIHYGALAKSCLFRWRYGDDWFTARVGMVYDRPKAPIIQVTARVMQE